MIIILYAKLMSQFLRPFIPFSFEPHILFQVTMLIMSYSSVGFAIRMNVLKGISAHLELYEASFKQYSLII